MKSETKSTDKRDQHRSQGEEDVVSSGIQENADFKIDTNNKVKITEDIVKDPRGLQNDDTNSKEAVFPQSGCIINHQYDLHEKDETSKNLKEEQDFFQTQMKDSGSHVGESITMYDCPDRSGENESFSFNFEDHVVAYRGSNKVDWDKCKFGFFMSYDSGESDRKFSPCMDMTCTPKISREVVSGGYENHWASDVNDQLNLVIVEMENLKNICCLEVGTEIICSAQSSSSEMQEASSSVIKSEMLRRIADVNRMVTDVQHQMASREAISAPDEVAAFLRVLELQTSIESLASNGMKMHMELQGLKTWMVNCQKECNLARNHVSGSKLAMEALIQQFVDEKRPYTEKLQEIEELKNCIREKQIKIRELEMKLAMSGETFKGLLQSNNNKDKELESLRNELKTADHQTAEIVEENSMLTQELNSLLHQTKTHMMMKSSPSIKMAQVMRRRRSLMKRVHSSLDTVSKEFKDLNLQLSPALKYELGGPGTFLRMKNTSAGSSKSSVQSDRDSNESFHNIAPSRLQDLYTQWGAAGERLLSTMIEVRKVMDIILVTRSVVEADLELKLNESNQRLRDTEHHLENLRNITQDNDFHRAELQKQCLQMKKELSSRNHVVCKLEKDLHELQKKLQQEETNCKEARRHLKNTQSSLDAQNKQVHRLEDQLNVAQRDKELKVKEMQSSLDKARADHTNLDRTCQDKEMKLGKVRGDIAALTTSLQRVNGVVTSQLKEITDLKKSIRKMTEEMQGMVEEKKMLKDSLSSEVDKRKQMRNVMDKLEKQKSQMEKLIEQKMAWKKVQEERDRVQKMQQKKTQNVEEMMQRLRANATHEALLDKFAVARNNHRTRRSISASRSHVRDYCMDMEMI